MIKSAGYRIGPAEIESCLVKHPAVANAAVIGKPDATRGAIVKAFIVLQPGHAPGESAGGAKSRATCAGGWRPTSIRARSSSSTRCP